MIRNAKSLLPPLFIIVVLAYTFTPLGLLIWELVAEVRLDPATCQIKEKVEDGFYEVFVIPESDTDPFSKVVEVTALDFNDQLEKGEKLECFFKIDREEEETDITVQFHSNRRKPDTLSVVLSSVWLAFNLVVIAGALIRNFVWKRDTPAGTGSVC